MSTHLIIHHNIMTQRRTKCSPYLVGRTDIQTEQRGQRGINDCVKNGEGIQVVFREVFERGYSQLRGVSV